MTLSNSIQRDNDLHRMMINQTEADERAYLEEVKAKLHDALDEIDARVRRYAEEIQEQKNYSWEHRAEMDHAEKVSTRQAITQAVFTGEAALEKKKRIQKLLASPYFGRFDFTEHGRTQTTPMYVGIHAFYDENLKKNLVFDWRAPVSTLFYDYETGAARYDSPAGEVAGEISLKRQYRIRQGNMEFMLESGLHIVDDVLQEELGRASDERMKTIVATIQRDQNAIIRNEHSQVLIIQGVAGSGKTSIALHRIAYLLYKFKDTLKSEDILIISPNKVFADYISNVLPELGEEQIAETEMEVLAQELLDYQYKFQTFFEQNELLLKNDDPALGHRIQAKSSLAFLRRLDAYIDHVEKNAFMPADIKFGRKLVPAWYLEESFRKHRYLPMSLRIDRMAKDVEGKIGIHYNYDLLPRERAELKAALKAMTQVKTLRNTYKDFFVWLGQPELLKPAKNSRLEYSDVFPLIYLKLRLEGIKKNYKNVKHLLVDEMQDYTPVQYAVISRLFPCKKTILGDANQSVNPYGSSTAEEISKVFSQAYCAKLCKSYRSSYEITRFAQRISPNAELVAIERHGEEPGVLGFASKNKELEHLRASILAFAQSGHRTLGIICKTRKHAEQLHKALHDEEHKVHLLGAGSAAFVQGVVICTAHLAKGLEFDQVIIPQASDENY
ncbi:MAG: AAA family ATPase, partial [Methylobacter sp.]|nr:AAA family ATPase [Methylobacter sp.]